MTISTNDVKIIASNGGGMILDARHFSATDLKIIASNAATGGGIVTLKNAFILSASDLKIIASNSKGHVVLDLSE